MSARRHLQTAFATRSTNCCSLKDTKDWSWPGYTPSRAPVVEEDQKKQFSFFSLESPRFASKCGKPLHARCLPNSMPMVFRLARSALTTCTHPRLEKLIGNSNNCRLSEDVAFFRKKTMRRPRPITVASSSKVVAQHEDERGGTMLTTGQQSRATLS